MRPAVRIDDHGEGSRRVRLRRACTTPRGCSGLRRRRTSDGSRSPAIRASERISATSSPPRRTRTRRIRRSARSETITVTSAARAAPWTPGSEVRRSGCRAARAAPHVELRGVVLRREQDVVADVEDRRDLEPGRRDRLAVHGDPARVLRLLDEHEAAIGQPVRHARSRPSASARRCGRRASASSPRTGRPRARPSASDRVTGRAASAGTGRST